MAIYNDRVKQLRLQNNFTLKEVAQRLHISEATAQRYESGNGIKSIPYEKLVEYANMFDCTPEYLMGWESNLELVDTDKMLDVVSDKTLLAYVEKLASLDKKSQESIFYLIDKLCKE